MTTNKDFDSKQNISKERALQIQATFLSLSPVAVAGVFEDFCKSEPSMGKVSRHIIDMYTKLIINNVMMGGVRAEEEQTFDPLGGDPVDEALQVANLYKSISSVMTNVYLIGLHSGRVMVDDQFYQNFDLGNIVGKAEEIAKPAVNGISFDHSKKTNLEDILKQLFGALGFHIEKKPEDDEEQE